MSSVRRAVRALIVVRILRRPCRPGPVTITLGDCDLGADGVCDGGGGVICVPVAPGSSVDSISPPPPVNGVWALATAGASRCQQQRAGGLFLASSASLAAERGELDLLGIRFTTCSRTACAQSVWPNAWWQYPRLEVHLAPLFPRGYVSMVARNSTKLHAGTPSERSRPHRDPSTVRCRRSRDVRVVREERTQCGDHRPRTYRRQTSRPRRGTRRRRHRSRAIAGRRVGDAARRARGDAADASRAAAARRRARSGGAAAASPGRQPRCWRGQLGVVVVRRRSGLARRRHRPRRRFRIRRRRSRPRAARSTTRASVARPRRASSAPRRPLARPAWRATRQALVLQVAHLKTRRCDGYRAGPTRSVQGR